MAILFWIFSRQCTSASLFICLFEPVLIQVRLWIWCPDASGVQIFTPGTDDMFIRTQVLCWLSYRHGRETDACKLNCSIPVFKSHNSIARKQIRVTNLNRGNTSNIRGKHLNFNKKTKTNPNILISELFYDNSHISDLEENILRK